MTEFNEKEIHDWINKILAPIKGEFVKCRVKKIEDMKPGSDIDLYIIISDTKKEADLLEKIFPMVREAIIGTGIFFSCFPISESRYNSEDSQFLKNIKSDAEEFKIR